MSNSSPDNSSSSSSTTAPRVRKRDLLKSFAHSASSAISSSSSSYSTTFRGLVTKYMPSDTEPHSTGLKRTATQEIDEILKDDTPDNVQPECLLFPTYACEVDLRGKTDSKGDELKWKVTLAGWAFAKPTSSRLDQALLAAGRLYGGFPKDSPAYNNFSALLNQFRCQTLHMVDIQLTLPGIIAEKIINGNQDLLNQEQQEKIRDYAASVNTGSTGRFEKEVLLSTPSVLALKEKSKYLTVEASFKPEDPSFSGYVDIIDQHGISIVSDIDDTIKITDIPDGKDAIINNTFFSAPREVAGMSAVYQAWAAEGTHFHYVSNGPWQVYPVVSELFTEYKFPQGSLHLRSISARELIKGKPGQHKLEVIPKIMKDFPDRKFILIGDTGEIDPEVYQQIYNQFPDQVLKIFIHDVSSQRAENADERALQKENSDTYYSMLKKFISKESVMFRKDASTELAMEAVAEAPEVPEEEKTLSDPTVPVKTKIEQFEERITRVSAGMREGVFKLFTNPAELLTDPMVTEEILARANNNDMPTTTINAAATATVADDATIATVSSVSTKVTT